MPVHPHARGEHSSSTSRIWSISGSSPRAWGTPCLKGFICVHVRFIPTRVGNTWLNRLRRLRPSVHPHARGEHLPIPHSAVSEIGSSPRAWGTPPPIRFPAAQPRFIPTRVGNTATQTRSSARSRFIPTRVGNTVFEFRDCVYSAVHPHARGEHIDGDFVHSDYTGSSPRAWGTLDLESGKRLL